ncbi:hypothetical protein EDD18DRAFT_1399694 [Armillaria luteobubalina]|uniref:DUF6534 domain-containing protein n=1 Tax=Armillaria luteobubalina TaxID=153913 RepID=A0AA39QLW8_9AGAR|nr:hypothetical protein EDD18DRAFT_1399694 [Armillaria luteobubalina]
MPMGNISLDNTLGAFSLGATLANILFGITCLQSALYYKNYPNDGWLYKVSVGLIWLLDTFDVAVTTHTIYFYAIKNFGNIQVLTQRDIEWSFKLHIVICVLVRIFVQAPGSIIYSFAAVSECIPHRMYALRVWKFGQKLHQGIPWLIVLVTASNSACGIYLIKDVYLVSSFSDTPTIKSALISMFVTSMAAEFIVSVTMCYCLDKGRTMSVFPNTIATLITMMRMILMAGIVTSFYSIVILVTFLLWPDTLIFLGFDCLAPKLFINSLLALLNARGNLRNTKSSFHLPTIDSTGLTSESMHGQPVRDKKAIVVSTEIES